MLSIRTTVSDLADLCVTIGEKRPGWLALEPAAGVLRSQAPGGQCGSAEPRHGLQGHAPKKQRRQFKAT
jgi:hypothetical protein